jgi:hypothetical protein
MALGQQVDEKRGLQAAQKRLGKGRFLEECRGTYAANFWYRTLAMMQFFPEVEVV